MYSSQSIVSPPREYVFNYNICTPNLEFIVTTRWNCFHMGIKNLPHSHGVGNKIYWTISDLLCIRQRKHLHSLQLVNCCQCCQCTKWSSFAIHGNRVRTCQALRLGVTLLLLCPIHMMIMWYHQIVKWMRCDCRVGIHLYHLQSSLQPRYWIFSKCRRCLDCRLPSAFLFQSYACVLWWSTLIVCHEKTPFGGVSGQFVNWSSSGWV